MTATQLRQGQISSPVKATGAENVAGTDDAKFLTALSNIPAFYSFLTYQAIINGGFTVNQRGYVSAATLASGAYGHDRWKAGSGGGNYSFTQLAQSTVITIASGKSLIQVIEDKNVIGGTYTLSWTGTATARYAVNSATPAGSYVASPIVITGQTAGTVMSIEFTNGTLSNVQLNVGSVALPFQPKSQAEELSACMRYFESARNVTTFTTFGSVTSGRRFSNLRFAVLKRAVPTVTLFDAAGTSGKVTAQDASGNNANNQAYGATSPQLDMFYIYTDSVAWWAVAFTWTADAEL